MNSICLELSFCSGSHQNESHILNTVSQLRHYLDQKLVLVGSHPGCDLCLPSAELEPFHCQLSQQDGRLKLTNRAVSGTKVGDEIVTKEIYLADGDEIALGDISAVVRFLEASTPSLTATIPLATFAQSLKIKIYTLLQNNHDGTSTSHPLSSAASLAIGNDKNNDIVLNDQFVSAHHAQIYGQNNRIMVRNLGSRNGITVNGVKVEVAEIPVGATIVIGQSTFVLNESTNGKPQNAITGQEVGEQSLSDSPLLGQSPAMAKLNADITKMAAADVPLLITGETGTGKEVIAHQLVAESPRATKPLQIINCAALGNNLIESELFGHEKGAFTGAIDKKMGAFESANGGTLFLDEIGELPLNLQPQLLRAVEYGEIRRVGGTKTIHVNVRLLAATNRILAQEVSAGRFREDLFHRLHVLTLESPPLRHRGPDLLMLAHHFVAEFSKGVCTLNKQGEEKITAHRWPGNVRELRNTILRSVLMRDSDTLNADAILLAPSTLEETAEAQTVLTGKTLAELEQEAIEAELIRYNGNHREVGDALGVSRSTVHRKVEYYKIDLQMLLGK